MVDTYGAHECRVYFVQETGYGETPADPSMLGVNSEGLEPTLNHNLIELRGIGSRDLQALNRGLRGAQLKINHVVPGDAPIAFIQHVGTLNSLSVQVLYYKGLYASATDILSFLYKGCRIDKLTVECSVEDFVKAAVELVGQDVETGTAKISGANYADYAGYVPFHSSYVQKGDASGGNLTTIERVTDWKVTIENNLAAVPVIRSSNGYLLKYLVAKHRNLHGEVTFEFEDKAEFDECLSDAEFSLKFGVGGSNSLLFTHCKWDETSLPTRLEDLVALKARFVARDVYIS